MTTNINADNGVISGIAGLKTSADNSGVLALQTNGTTAVTVNASQAIGVGSTPSFGTAGQVLTSAGSGAPPTWAAGGGGSSQWTTSGSNIYYNTGNVAVGSTTVVASTGKSYQLGSNVLLQNVVNGQMMLSQNAVYDSTWKYITAGRAAAIRIGAQNDGEISIHYSNAVGTAGGALSSWDANKSMVITQTGQVLVGPTSAQSGGCNFQVSQGVTFPATQSASTDANTLDDYEEGSFTPTLASGFLTAPTGYTAQLGRYTKIGNFVFFQIDINPDGAVANSSQIQIGGLPFSSAGQPNGGATIGFQGSFNTNTDDTYLIGQTDTKIYAYTNAGTDRAGNSANVNINNRIVLTGCYAV